MNADKEIDAFVDRMAKRLNDSPKGSRRGRHRAAFIAVRPLIEGALGRGHTLKATWEALCDESKLSMTYETFRAYCRAMGLGTGPRASSADHPQTRQPPLLGRVLAPGLPTSAARESARRTAPVAQPSPTGSNTSSFRHERVPRTDKIYG